MLFTRGIRGAISVEKDRVEDILSATRELLVEIQSVNPGLLSADLAGVFFTLTDDLSSAYPAQAARQLGWLEVPLLCSREIPVHGGMPKVIRVLLLWNTGKQQSEVRHVFLRRAASLRPDLMNDAGVGVKKENTC